MSNFEVVFIPPKKFNSTSSLGKSTDLSHRRRERARHAVLSSVPRRFDTKAEAVATPLLHRSKLLVREGGVILGRRGGIGQGTSPPGEEGNGGLHRWDGVFDGGGHRPTLCGGPETELRVFVPAGAKQII